MKEGPLPPPIGLYVHIPFCRRRCRYCNFAIVPVGYDGVDKLEEEYTTALLTELESISVPSPPVTLRSIYFGGGTPSLASLESFERIFDFLRSEKSPFDVDGAAEITVEIDPGTFSELKLAGLKDLGINRLSFGVQSFNDTLLESLGRVHRSQDIVASLDMLFRVYGEGVNYSIDLISSLPGLSLADWANTLEKASKLVPRPAHMSLYDLQIESGTVFDKWYGNNGDDVAPSAASSNLLQLPSEEDSAFMYKYAAGYLRSKGFQHYEVSSYACNGKRSQHNQIYWDTDGHWYAVGLGATSFVNRRLVARPRALSDYLEWVRRPCGVRDCSGDEENAVQDMDHLMDVTLKRLRTAEGLSLEWVRSTFDRGDEYCEAILRGAELGIKIHLATLEYDVLRLKDPDGFLYSNSIISSIFAELEEVGS